MGDAFSVPFIVSWLNTNKCSIQSIDVQFVKAAVIVVSVPLKISNLFVVSHVLSASKSSE